MTFDEKLHTLLDSVIKLQFGGAFDIGPVHMRTNHASERRFRTWFGPFLIWKPDFSPCERKAVSNQAFETRKKAFWMIRVESLILGKRKALSERDSCVSILKMRTEAMHGSISADCAGKEQNITSQCADLLGRRLQCMWTHVVQITIPINRDPKRLSERDSFSCEHSHWCICWTQNGGLQFQLQDSGGR